MSAHLNIHSTINDFVQEDVRRTALLEQLGIDACCGGHKTLAQACGEKGLDPETVLQQILAGPKEDAALSAVTEGMDGSLSEAVDHREVIVRLGVPGTHTNGFPVVRVGLGETS